MDTLTHKGPHNASGVVRGDEVYSLTELRRRLQWGEHATRMAKAAGLRLVPFGREKFVLGADVLAFFRKLADRQQGVDSDKQSDSGEVFTR